jgi:hypothetical protein
MINLIKHNRWQILLMLILLFSGIGYSVILCINYYKGKNSCAEKGGLYVKTGSGFVCVDSKRIISIDK